MGGGEFFLHSRSSAALTKREGEKERNWRRTEATSQERRGGYFGVKSYRINLRRGRNARNSQQDETIARIQRRGGSTKGG